MSDFHPPPSFPSPRPLPIDPQTLLAAIIDSSDDAILSKTLDGIVTSWNLAAQRLFGYAPEEIVGHPITLLIPPDRQSEEVLILEQLRKGEKIRRFETLRRAKDGRLIEVSLTIAPIRDASGAIVGASKIIRDITDRNRAQAAHKLADHARIAELANQAKSEFLANMSHEIRTPMTAILGYADLLLDPDQSASDRLNALNVIRRNGSHLLAVVNDILDLSKIEAGEMKIERIPVPLCQLLTEIASSMRVRAKEKNLHLHVAIQGAIPETLSTDPTRLRQILINLLGNAIKFTESGAVVLRTSLLDPPDHPQPRLRFDVIDTGIGMSADQISALFQPFVQADSSTTRRFGGTGLGLTVSRRLARALGGDITVDSALGRGSTFSLTLTLESLGNTPLITHCAESIHDPPLPQPLPLPELRGHILLADDGPDNQALLSHYLHKAGAIVTLADNGAVVVEKVRDALRNPDASLPFELILMDMQMPEMDGYTATARIRALGFDKPIIALTAHAMAADRDKCIAAGCTDYLSKPVPRRTLLEIIQRHLPQRPAPAPTPRATLDDEDREIMQKLLPGFVANLPHQVYLLRTYLDNRQWDHLGNELHRIRGSAGLFGFLSVHEAATRGEDQILAHQPPESIAAHVHSLIALLRNIPSYDPAQETPPPP